MRSLLPLTLYCISLVSLQKLHALPAQERPDTHRSLLLTKLMDQRQDEVLASESRSSTASPSTAPSPSLEWLSALLRRPPASGMKVSSTGLASAAKTSQMTGRAMRVRRHNHQGSRGGHHHPHHAQLMRVGCVLGTCQVQNLSHRLYQLIGQNGREDSSPINPRSPHSYG